MKKFPVVNTPVPEPPKKRARPEAVRAHEPHSWELPAKSNQPDWLNDNGGTRKHCTKCGVTLRTDVLRVDLPKSYYTYEDASGKVYTSYVPLGCPAFLGDHAGTTMGNKERIRELDDRVDSVEVRIDGNRNDIDNHEDRLYNLEQENKSLRDRIDSAEAHVGAVVLWLRQMASLHKSSGLPTKLVDVDGRQVALPGPVLDMILEVGSIEDPEGVEVFVPKTTST